jgi:hypothetical protein
VLRGLPNRPRLKFTIAAHTLSEGVGGRGSCGTRPIPGPGGAILGNDVVAVGGTVPEVGLTIPQMMLISVVYRRRSGRGGSEDFAAADFRSMFLSAWKPEA